MKLFAFFRNKTIFFCNLFVDEPADYEANKLPLYVRKWLSLVMSATPA